jgi:peptidoglycan/LPS O-acetylase OafA/YrhL
MSYTPINDLSKSQDSVNFPYYSLLDGLRGFAILAVVYAHSSLSSVILNKLNLGEGGFIGVDVFFVLSSFLITSLLLREYLNHGSISIKKFYIRRLLRLTPPLLTAMIIFIPIIATINWKLAVKDIFYTLTYTANIPMSLQSFIPREFLPGYFYHTWSLATEEQFYLVFPAILVYIVNKKTKFFTNNFYILLTIIAIFITAPILKPLLNDGIYSFPLLRSGEFFIGFLAALIYANFSWKQTLARKANFLIMSEKLIDRISALINSSILSLSAFSILFSFIFFAHPHSWFVTSIGHLSLSFIAAFLILQITVCPNKTTRYFLGSKAMVFIGSMSYGLYVYHLPIMLIEKAGLNKISNFTDKFILLPQSLKAGTIIALQDLTYIILSFGISYISYKFLEKPIMKYKASFSKA